MIDNDIEPLIWVHATQTAYIPMLSFVDVILEGEDRFPPWGAKRNFITTWGLDRLRYSSPRKWGIPVNWMWDYGGPTKQPAPQPMPHWKFAQDRAWRGACLLMDIPCAGGDRKARESGYYSDDGRFLAYWDKRNPFNAKTKDCHVSVYRQPDRDLLVLVNAGKTAQVAEFAVDPKKLAAGMTLTNTQITDTDTEKPPKGDSVLKYRGGGGVEMSTLEDLGETADPVLAGFEDDLAEEMGNQAMTPEEREQLWFTDENWKWEAGSLRLRIRACDFRLLQLTRRGGE
jgi:hypothetical protein